MAPDPERYWITTWTSLTEEKGAVLREMAKDKVVLEIGSAFGYSTACLALTANRVHAIDPHNVEPGRGNYGFSEQVGGYERTYQVWEKLLQDLELRDKVELHLGYSQQLLAPYSGTTLVSELIAEGVSLAFIDGDHAYGAAMQDFSNCARLCNTLLIDDYGDTLCPDVKPALDFWLRERTKHSRKPPTVRFIDTMAIVEL